MRVVWETRRQLDIEVVKHDERIETWVCAAADVALDPGTDTFSLLFGNECGCDFL